MKNIISVLIFLVWINQTIAQINPIWSTSYGANFPYSIEGNDMAIDSDGNALVIGYLFDTASTFTGVAIKYNTYGQMEWVRIIDSLFYYSKIAVDDSNNVYVCGSFNNGIKTMKFDTYGNLLWNRSISGGTYLFAIVTDHSNSIYGTGISNGFRFTTFKYDSQGNLKWLSLDTISNGLAKSSMTLDNENNTYISVRGYDTINSVYKTITIKYDTSGVKKWQKMNNGIVSVAPNSPVEIKFHPSGYVYVLSSASDTVFTNTSFNVAKYDTLGTEIWNYSYSFTNYFDVPKGFDLDNSGNVYVTGNIYPTGGTIDTIVTIKISSSGSFQWKRYYSSGYSNSDEATGIAIDYLNNVYVIGKSPDNLNDENYVTIKYDTLGNQIWLSRFKYTNNSWDVSNSIELDYIGNIYISGTTRDLNTSGILTIKYSSAVGINESDLHEYQTLEVSPNPFTYSFSLKSKNKFNNAIFQLIDITGKLILEIPGINENNIVIQRGQLNVGLYFFRITENNQIIANGKVIAN